MFNSFLDRIYLIIVTDPYSDTNNNEEWQTQGSLIATIYEEGMLVKENIEMIIISFPTWSWSMPWAGDAHPNCTPLDDD